MFAGYFENSLDKEFECSYVNDKTLIELMQLERPQDRFLLVDWKDIRPDLSTEMAYDWKRKQNVSYSMQDSDSVVMLATPTKVSTHVSLSHVNPLWQKMDSLKIPGVNPARSCLEFGDKSYFMKYPELPFPRTFSTEQGLENSLSQLGESVIVKPIDTDGGYCVHRVDNNPEKIRALITEYKKDAPFIVQEFVPEIAQGERSLYFFNKQFRYAMIKRPKQGEFRSNWRYVDLLAPYTPTSNELAIAQNALETINAPSVLERVDMVSSGRIIEMTLDCPGLYLEEAGVNDRIGKWFYEAVDASISRGNN